MDSLDRMITSKYWNTNGIGIAIVAIEGYANDVSCYIGASKAGAQTRKGAERDAITSGAKLSRFEALDMLPGLYTHMSEHNLTYRA